jgi:hypothetical protein
MAPPLKKMSYCVVQSLSPELGMIIIFMNDDYTSAPGITRLLHSRPGPRPRRRQPVGQKHHSSQVPTYNTPLHDVVEQAQLNLLMRRPEYQRLPLQAMGYVLLAPNDVINISYSWPMHAICGCILPAWMHAKA